MPQLNLNLEDIPIPETCLWEQFDDEQKRTVIESLARLLVKATQDTCQEQVHCKPGGQSAALSRHSPLPAACRTTQRRSGLDSQGGTDYRMNTSSIHRWLADDFIAVSRSLPALRGRFESPMLLASILQQTPAAFLPTLEATRKPGVSRQTVLRRVKRGEIKAVLVRQGRRNATVSRAVKKAL